MIHDLKKLSIAIVLIIVVFLIGTYAKINKNPNADWKTYINNEYGFELQHPSNFKETTDTNSAGLFSLYLGYNNTQYMGDISIRVYKSGKSETVAQYFARKKIQDTEAFASHCQTCAASDIDAEIDDCMVNNTNKTIIGGKDAFTCKQMPERARHFNLNPTYVSQNGYIYEFKDNSSTHDEEYRKILSTFKFTAPTPQDDTSNWKTYSGYGFSFKYPQEMGAPTVSVLSTRVEVSFKNSVTFTSGVHYNQDLGRIMTFDEIVNQDMNDPGYYGVTKKYIMVGGKTGTEISYGLKDTGGRGTIVHVPQDAVGNILTISDYNRAVTNTGGVGVEQILPTVQFTNGKAKI